MIRVKVSRYDRLVDIEKAVQVLRQGGVVAHATETCYGLACDMTNPNAVKKVFDLKRREYDKPVSALFENWQHAKEYVESNEEVEQLASEKLPGPFVFVLSRRADAPKTIYLTADGESYPTIGVRVSLHPTARALTQAYGSPLSTTSVNIAGEPPCYSPGEIHAQGLAVDLILDDGEIPKNPPSKIVDLSSI